MENPAFDATPTAPPRPPPTDRAFAGTVAVLALLVAGVSAWRGGSAWPWALGVALALALVAVVAPRLVGPLNRATRWLGERGRRVTEPLFLGLVFFAAVTPLGLLARLMRRDFVGRRFEPEAKSYFREREPLDPERFRRPF
jgi:hypothetical protein